jgi:hypothetical protein
MPASIRSAGRAAALRLFNVDHEVWEEVDIGDTTPPHGALAFDVERVLWISVKEGLTSLRNSATVRYTKHGLDLLREEGYEG